MHAIVWDIWFQLQMTPNIVANSMILSNRCFKIIYSLCIVETLLRAHYQDSLHIYLVFSSVSLAVYSNTYGYYSYNGMYCIAKS